MDRLDDIALFLRVLDTGSISAAARSLDLSVAVASQRLRRLEGALGVRLLQRTTRRLHPTPEGQALATNGRVLVQDLQALAESLREPTQGVSGTLRVTMSASFGRMYVSPLLPEFQARHPRLRISAHLSDDLIDLVGLGYDLAIRLGTLHDSSLVARPIAANRQLLCAAPDYLHRRGNPLRPQDLAEHDGILLMGRDGRQDHWALLGPAGEAVTVRMHSRFESNLGDLLRDAVLAGQGIALHSLWHVADDLRAGRLHVVLPDYQPAPTRINAVMPARRLQPPRVRAFVDFLIERLGTPSPWER